jgi:hypothetical protein
MIDILLNVLVSVLLVVFLSNNPYVLFGALIIQIIIIQRIRPLPILFYVLCGFGGTIVESISIKYGIKTWKYMKPTYPLNIPIWLVPLWSIASVVVLRISEELKYYT